MKTRNNAEDNIDSYKKFELSAILFFRSVMVLCNLFVILAIVSMIVAWLKLFWIGWVFAR